MERKTTNTLSALNNPSPHFLICQATHHFHGKGIAGHWVSIARRAARELPITGADRFCCRCSWCHKGAKETHGFSLMKESLQETMVSTMRRFLYISVTPWEIWSSQKKLSSIASHIQARTVPVTGRVLGRAGCPRNAEASPLAKKGRATSVSPRRNAMANPNAPRHWSSKAKTQSLIWATCICRMLRSGLVNAGGMWWPCQLTVLNSGSSEITQ